MDAKRIYELTNGFEKARATRMEINDLVTTPTEEIILEHMVGILEAVKRVQPDHGIISLGISDGYFDLMCGGENIFDKLNFTLRTKNDEVDHDYICRYVPGTPEHDRRTVEFDATSLKDYLFKAKKTRIDFAVRNNKRKAKSEIKGNPYHNISLIGNYPDCD